MVVLVWIVALSVVLWGWLFDESISLQLALMRAAGLLVLTVVIVVMPDLRRRLIAACRRPVVEHARPAVRSAALEALRGEAESSADEATDCVLSGQSCQCKPGIGNDARSRFNKAHTAARQALPAVLAA